MRLASKTIGTAIALAASLLLTAPASATAATPAPVWEKLRAGGYTILIRHATTVPGLGDPPGFRLGECATQRNLSDAGRDEARAIGARFRAQKAPIAEVLSSRWCRCLDTARLAFGKATPFPALDSFFDDRSTQQRQTETARGKIAAFRGPGNLVMVTHQVNISALTGAYPGQGEAFVVRAGAGDKLELVARIPPD